MADITKEKVGNIIFNGKIYNIESMSPEELTELENELVQQQTDLQNRIKEMLDM